MPTILKTKNSVTTTVVPTTLQQGELAVNITDKKLWVGNAATTPVQLLGAGVTGDVVGPASATDNAISRFDGTTGKLIQNSLVTVSDTGAISAPVDASISGLTVGKGGGAVSTNTALGTSALASNTTGASNIGIGYQAANAVTTSSQVVAVGDRALKSTTGADNIGVGFAAGFSNTSGANNIAIGTQSLFSNTTASNNTAVGYQAGYSNTGGNNTTVGGQALYANTTGAELAAFGRYALGGNTTGSNNTAVGSFALQANTTASDNTAVGYQAAYSNTTGSPNSAFGSQALYSTTTGSNNTAIGRGSMYSNTTGAQNTSLGREALYSNTTAGNNTAVGYQTLYSTNKTIDTAANNTAVGTQTGYSTTTGIYNAFFGIYAGYGNTTGSYNTYLGAQNSSGVGCAELMTTGSNNTIIGGFSGNQDGLDIRTASGYIVLSDGKGQPIFYNNGQGSSSMLCIVNAPEAGQRYCGFEMDIGRVSKSQIYWDNVATNLYVINSSGGVYLTDTGTSWTSNSDERLKENLVPIENGLDKVCSLRSVIGNFIADETKTPHPFLIAQDVEAVLPEAVSKTTLKDDESGTEYLGVSYTETIPLLVAAIKELKAEIDQLKGN